MNYAEISVNPKNLLLKLTFRTLMSALVIMIKRILEELLKDKNLVEI